MRFHRMYTGAAACAALATLAVVMGCAGGQGADVLAPQAAGPGAFGAAGSVGRTGADEAPEFDPANFVTGVTHPYFPLVPGTVATFKEGSGPGAETVVVEVLTATKSILGIAATVVRDRVYVDGQLVEDTDDWYAQDKDGNVWYLGEAVLNYENGQLVDTNGSWEAGVAGAKAGIQMLAEPETGESYYQEYAVGIAEDEARVRSIDVDVEVPYGEFDDCIQILEWTKLEPGNRGFKYYARGVGLVLESPAQAGGTRGRVELVSVAGP